MRREHLLLWILTLTLFILVPGAVMAEKATPAEARLSETLMGRRALRQGDRGPAVAALQRLLAERGFDPVKLDGIFGPLTERAVKEAQAALGLTRDGLAGVQTTSALEAAASRAPAVVTADLFQPAGAPRQPSSTLVVHTVQAEPTAAEPFALTFNGNPDPLLLPTVLKSLARYEMKATFFLTAEMAESRPDLVAAMVAAGHEIGLNGPSQAALVGLSEREMTAQLSRALQTVTAAAGREVTQFRPPRGLTNSVLEGVASSLGLVTTLWTNVAVTDHPGLAPGELAERLAAMAYPGSVLMVHQDRPGTVEALEPLLKELAARGARSLPLSDLGRS